MNFKIFSYTLDFCLFCWLVFFAMTARHLERAMAPSPFQVDDDPGSYSTPSPLPEHRASESRRMGKKKIRSSPAGSPRYRSTTRAKGRAPDQA